MCELYHDKNWKEKGLLYQFSWRIGGAVLAVPPGENGPGWGPLIERPWGGLVLGHEDYPYGAPDFPKPNLTWSARSGCPGCWTSLWLGRQSRRGCHGGALK